jgi:hypothetical protein
MFERIVCSVAGFAFAIGQAAQVDRLLNRQTLDYRCRARRIGQNRVADAAVFGDDLAGIANSSKRSLGFVQIHQAPA